MMRPITTAGGGSEPAPQHGAIEAFRQRYREAVLSGRPSPAARAWRFGLFERGLELADEIEARFGSLQGRHILDVGGAFGGDAVALCARGATCVITDLTDHRYAELKGRLGVGEQLQCLLYDCAKPWPFADDSFDAAISIGVIDHLRDLQGFFSELLRVLRPDGFALVYTPPVARMLHCDAHYHLPLVAILPMRLRRWVAERICHRRYDLSLSDHTFVMAHQLRRYVTRLGHEIQPQKYASSPIMNRVSRWPLASLWQSLLRAFAYDFILLVPKQ